MPAIPFFSSGSARVRTMDVHIRTGMVIPSVNTLSEKSHDRYAAEVSTSFNPSSSKERTGTGISAGRTDRGRKFPFF